MLQSDNFSLLEARDTRLDIMDGRNSPISNRSVTHVRHRHLILRGYPVEGLHYGGHELSRRFSRLLDASHRDGCRTEHTGCHHWLHHTHLLLSSPVSTGHRSCLSTIIVGHSGGSSSAHLGLLGEHVESLLGIACESSEVANLSWALSIRLRQIIALIVEWQVFSPLVNGDSVGCGRDSCQRQSTVQSDPHFLSCLL